MKIAGRIAVIGVLLFVLTGTGRAQMGMMRQGPQPRGFFNPIVGSGAEYEIHTDKNKVVMQVAVVGKESVDGKDGYWFETTMNNTQMGEVVVKVLTTLDGSNITSTHMIMQMGNRPPMEMSSDPGGMSTQKAEPADIRSRAEDVGSESITTPAGTFACEHYRMKDGSGDAWVSSKISPYGLVKHEGKNSTMILTKVVSDAKDKITGTPRPFNQMMLGPGAPRQQN